ncbi:MAG: glycoside hydrolase family 5 protein, partial [Acidobacteriota bacterium]|nr:glycoside hydrolase family 5 protein [Acidobacteriota bacterium]
PREIEAFFNELIGPSAAEEFWREYRKRYITEADIHFIQRSGLNSVRIPLHYKLFLEGGEGFAILDPAIAWCKRAGLWVILDLHCAPGGQTGTNIDDSWGYPWLYESEHDQQNTCHVWRSIAQHYSEETIILGYDLLNEPIPHFPSLQQYNSKLEPLYKQITAAIREVDRNHLIVLGGAQWDSNFKVFGPPFDNKLVYELHKYWMPPAQASIQQYIDFRERYNVPIWLGESGENTDDWIRQFVTLLEKDDIGWCFWPYKKMEKTSCMVSVPKPVDWDAIVAFAKMPGGAGQAEKRIAARPSIADCRGALDDLLDKVNLASCRVNSGYCSALGLRASVTEVAQLR